MKIGVNAWALESGSSAKNAGVSRAVANMIPAMAAAGPEHEFHVWVLPRVEVPDDWGAHPNLIVHRIWPKYRTWLLVGEAVEAKKKWIDVWLSMANRIPRIMPRKKFLVIYDLFPFKYPDMYESVDRERYFREFADGCRRADHLFCISEATKRDVLQRFPRDADDCTIIPMGPGNPIQRRAYADVTDAELDSMGVPFRRFLFGLSTLEPRKNFPRLIEAMGLLARDPDLQDVGLVVAGGRGWLEGPIFERVQELGLEERVKFLGFVPSEWLPALFARCEAFVCPSLDEGFGIPVLEAFLMGAPVISSDRGSLPEVGGDIVRYFDPEDTEGITESIRTFLREQPDRESLVLRGLERAKMFTWQRCGEIMVKAIAERCRRS